MPTLVASKNSVPPQLLNLPFSILLYLLFLPPTTSALQGTFYISKDPLLHVNRMNVVVIHTFEHCVTVFPSHNDKLFVYLMKYCF